VNIFGAKALKHKESMKLSRKPRLTLYGLMMLYAAFSIAPLTAQKLHLRPLAKSPNIRKHPHTHLLRQTSAPQAMDTRKSEFSKLLVILVDFQEDDDPMSTGNGKFMLEADPDYIYSIGAPPHNREYFETNLEAMRYYYRAVSANEYNLEYDVWPKDKAAYTLSNPMSYYNPPNAESSLFVSKMEEYFKEAFETADRDDPEIDFAQYAHYMIIHAGSDWQHDRMGDSPVDIPSFFIRVGEGKEAVVDGGSTRISHACNVPATISQDFSIQEDNGQVYHTGYGALNSVLFHEFGHSLGLVDLYNVQTFSPMVGAFDIMDSGGAGILVDELENGEYVYIEGILPALPGAFSRALLFEDRFRELGLMKDIMELKPEAEHQIAASSLQQTGSYIPSIIKIPISNDEYYLVENRCLDPDNDGGTPVFGALDGRVVLYPTALDDPTNQPTFEYDYLLPSFILPDGSARGGGILAWYVNEKVLYQEGRIIEDGSLWTNFQNNSVNTNFDRPGVMVLEADGIRDLGEYYSWYWTGTAYEYFHARKPLLNSDGQFVQWTNQAWRPTLSSTTKPPMVGENGLGSVYRLENISDPLPLMSFTLKSSWFDTTDFRSFGGKYYAGEPINTHFSDLSIPYPGINGVHLISSLFDEWLEMVDPAFLDAWSFDHPAVSADTNADGFKELVGVKGSLIRFMDWAEGQATVHNLSCEDDLGKPLAYLNSVYTYSSQILYKFNDFSVRAFLDLPGIRSLGAFGTKLLAVQDHQVSILDAELLQVIHTVHFPEALGDYSPITCVDSEWAEIYITANSGNIYSFSIVGDRAEPSQLKQVFVNDTSYKPSQPGLLATPDNGTKIFFGLGNNAYLLAYNGMLEPGFPRYLSDIYIKERADGRALKLLGETLLHLPIHPHGYYAISTSGEPKPQYALGLPGHTMSEAATWTDTMIYDAENQRLLWYYTLAEEDNTSSYIHELAIEENPLLWNGFTDGGGATVSGNLLQAPGSSPLDAYVFPNPVKKGSFRLRVLNATDYTTIDIYDIGGTKVQSHAHHDPGFDLQLESRNLSSGVYLVRVKSGDQVKRFKFAVEK